MVKLSGVLFWSVWALMVVCFLPGVALAWGPGAHLDCSGYILESLALLAPAARTLLRKYPRAFMYGSLYPDMVLGKKYLRPEANNHRWRVGFNVGKNATSPRQEAFALGYLSHLAADTVAHHLFVPDFLLNQFARRGRGHVTFELIYDVMLNDRVWKDMRAIARHDFHECERLVIRSIPKTPVPARVNHRLFRGGAMLVRAGGWERIVRSIRPQLAQGVSPATLEPYRLAMRQCAFDIINDPQGADCLTRCPTGGAVLHKAEDLRKSLRHLDKRHQLDQPAIDRLIAAFNQWRRDSLFPEPADLAQ